MQMVSEEKVNILNSKSVNAMHRYLQFKRPNTEKKGQFQIDNFEIFESIRKKTRKRVEPCLESTSLLNQSL